MIYAKSGGKSVGTIEQTRQVWDWIEIFSILDHISCFLGIVMIRNNDLIDTIVCYRDNSAV